MSDLLNANLTALARFDEELARRLRATEPSTALRFESAKQESALTASLAPHSGARPIALASAYRPLTEAKKLADTADTREHATLLMLGMGLGYHVAELVERANDTAVVVAYEPDPAVLRAVLEQVDCSAWLGRGNVALFTGEVDGGRLTRRMERHVASISQGVQILTHPPTRRLHPESLNRFAEQFKQFVAFCRTNLATTLVNAAATCRNQAHNLGMYAAGASLDDLRDIAAGRPAVLVAAGPSLAKNIDLLKDSAVRRNVVVVAVQTVLKLLLAHGVRPDFVTALDYHEISRRFYEGLEELADVTLIAEPKAHRAIVDHYPGPVRLLQSRFLDLLLGPLAQARDGLTAGSTVAHLSFYLAQYLGCDPIVFIGQDLGFTDGVYYCPGTPIHEVWSAQLSPFNTLEMMEWKRIARQKGNLQKMNDIHGRPIYTDEQMLTYLRQFERDFAEAPQRIIDATEGGLPKENTQRMPLTEAIQRYATQPIPDMPQPSRQLDSDRLEAVTNHLADRRAQVIQLQQASRDTLPILRDMIDRQRDQAKMAQLFRKLEKHRKRVGELNDAFTLVNELNQVGALNRLKADRALRIDEPADPFEKQKRQLERDIENVRWLVEACGETLDIFDEAAGRLAARPVGVAV